MRTKIRVPGALLAVAVVLAAACGTSSDVDQVEASAVEEGAVESVALPPADATPTAAAVAEPAAIPTISSVAAPVGEPVGTPTVTPAPSSAVEPATESTAPPAAVAAPTATPTATPAPATIADPTATPTATSAPPTLADPTATATATATPTPTPTPSVPPPPLTNQTIGAQWGVTVYEVQPPANFGLELDPSDLVFKQVTVTCLEVGATNVRVIESAIGVFSTSCRESGAVVVDESRDDKSRYQFHFTSDTPRESLVQVRVETRLRVDDDGDSASNPRVLDLGSAQAHDDRVALNHDPVDSILLIPPAGASKSDSLNMQFACSSKEKTTVLMQVFTDQNLTSEAKIGCPEDGTSIDTPVDIAAGGEFQIVVTALDGGAAVWAWRHNG